MDGLLTVDEFKQALELAIEGCKQIYKMQKEALKAKYLAIREEVESCLQ